MDRRYEQSLQKDIHMTYKLMRRGYTSFVIQEIQIKTKMRCHPIPTRMANVKKTEHIK